MNHWMKGGVFLVVALLAALTPPGAGGAADEAPTTEPRPVTLVVMDPLAREMACACVTGYGQRDYRKLAAHLEKALKQRVAIEFSDDLADTLAFANPGPEILVIGERSVVAKGAAAASLPCRPICELTDPGGDTTMTGAFVARSGDPAKDLKDLAGRTLFFGLADTDENHAVAASALGAAALETPVAMQRRGAYTDAALDVLDSTSSPPAVGIIPGYALPLLTGCGSVKPGELKVLGRTRPVPFITVFIADEIAVEKAQRIVASLLSIKTDAALLEAMESKHGFRPVQEQTPIAPPISARTDWPDFRGPNRDGRVLQLPERLPTTATYIWKKAAMPGGLAGLSVSDGRLLLAERDFAEENDVYRCLDADTGELLWRIQFPARGHLDYGQSPRATPVIHDGKAYLLGAFGDLRCVHVADGKLIWQRQLPREFKAELPTWGMCSTPLVVDDVLIVNPGAANASLVALDLATGQTRWATPGSPAAYASFICGEFGGRRQIVGYDQHALGGWDAQTGEPLWRLTPPNPGDFNVPTPVAVHGGLVLATENNGTRFHQFDASGRIVPDPAGESPCLSPDTATPVATQGRIFGAHLGLHCLDLQGPLKPLWEREDAAPGDYATLIADDERVLVITIRGELVLLDATSDDGAIISRLRAFEDDVEVYPHPALVGTRLYLRGGSRIVCLDLKPDATDGIAP